MWSGQSLKALGLENNLKLVPRERSLYLISHASLENRGLSQGAATAYQMFHEPGNRLAFPFSLQSLQCGNGCLFELRTLVILGNRGHTV
jgi:hypothetical protein